VAVRWSGSADWFRSATLFGASSTQRSTWNRIQFFDMEGDDDRIMHGKWFVNACF
jgi:hypothetical protein